MDEQKVSALIEWTASTALAGRDEAALLEGFCRRAVDAGLQVGS